MKKRLIINADDANLTEGVNQAILECAEEGVLTSTSFIVNLPTNKRTITNLRKCKRLGVGLHLNATLGRPVLSGERVTSLLQTTGVFRKKSTYSRAKPKQSELYEEWESQIKFFKRLFGRMPTHLDTHHHLHGSNFHMKAFLQLAKKWKLPIRRPFKGTRGDSRIPVTTDYFLGSLNVNNHWNETNIIEALSSLRPGVTEMMTHPGKVDGDLKKISSFTSGRRVEYGLLRRKSLRKFIQSKDIELIHFGDLK